MIEVVLGCIMGALVVHVRWLAKTSDLRAKLANETQRAESLAFNLRKEWSRQYTPGM